MCIEKIAHCLSPVKPYYAVALAGEDPNICILVAPSIHIDIVFDVKRCSGSVQNPGIWACTSMDPVLRRDFQFPADASEHFPTANTYSLRISSAKEKQAELYQAKTT